MLILSRRAEQQIVFPNLGIKLRILQIRGRIVKVGIEAPPEIKVFRQEALARMPTFGILPDTADAPPADARSEHHRRNQLNVLQLRLDAIQHRIDRGELVDAERMVRSLMENLEVDNDHVAKVAQAEPDSGKSADPARPLRVMVVEDSDNERGLMTYLLASQGFVVHVARDGAEAYEQLDRWGVLPDVVLMDMQMPLFNGLEALRRIREDERMRHLRVYAVTGSKRVIEDEPVGHGWDRWFSKPLDIRELVAAIRTDLASETPATTSPHAEDAECRLP